MSATRASMSHAPRRISSKRTGSKPYSSTGRPTTALKPDVRQLLAVVDPGLAAVVLLDDAGGAVGELGGHPAVEGVGRLDDVVVGGDHRVAARGTRGLGEERHRAGVSRRALVNLRSLARSSMERTTPLRSLDGRETYASAPAASAPNVSRLAERVDCPARSRLTVRRRVPGSNGLTR